jgi:hypothetical protein
MSSGRSSGVEHNLAKVGVEGSNPFARSNNLSNLAQAMTAAAEFAPLHPHQQAPKPSVVLLPD